MSFSSSLIVPDVEMAMEHLKCELSKNMLFRKRFSLLLSLRFGDIQIRPLVIPLGVPPFLQMGLGQSSFNMKRCRSPSCCST